MAKRGASFISHSEQLQPQPKRTHASALNAPRKQPARVRFADSDDATHKDGSRYVDRVGDSLEYSCKPPSLRKKHSRPLLLENRDGEPAFRERLAFDLVGHELDQFQQWIARSADEPPAVAGAGAAKRIPDSELQMFRESRFPRTSSSCPPIFPLDGRTSNSSGNHKRPSPLQNDEDQQKQRPRSWEQSSSPRKSVRRNMDKIVSEKLASEALTLPLLMSPTRTIAKDKAAMLGLLAECKEKSSGLSSPTHMPEKSSQSPNQHSGRKQHELSNREVTIPDHVFYEHNSFRPLEIVDLSGWTCFCFPTSPVLEQISEKLSSHCVKLDLSGLSTLSRPNGATLCHKRLTDFQILLKRCSKLRRLVLSAFENIQKAGFNSIGHACPCIESLSLSESDIVTDDLLGSILANFPSLTNLDINGCVNITDAAILLFAKKTKPLEIVRIDRCQFVSEVSLLQLIKAQGAKLKVLSIRGCRLVSDVVVKELFVSQPKKLQELNVSGCINLTDACMEYLSTVPSYYGNRIATAYHLLVKIDVSNCPSFTSLVCCWIAASCPFLASLKAARCVKFCDKGITALASVIHLEELDLSSCTGISESGIERFLLASDLAKAPSSNSAERTTIASAKKMKILSLANGSSQGEKSVLAIVSSCFKSLVQLDVSNIAPLPSTALIKLVKACRAIAELRVRSQSGVTRAVLAHLASCNKQLRILDLRSCVNVDDLAIYPLLVMQSLEELYLTGCGRITKQGLQSLPGNLTCFDFQKYPKNDFDDEGCRILGNRLRKLEKLDVSHSSGISSSGVSFILQKCPCLYQLNLFDCMKINAANMDHLLRAVSKNEYGLEVIRDLELAFLGIGVADVTAAEKTRKREKAIAEEARRQQAAIAIQVRFTSRCRQQRKRKAEEERDWEEFCCAVDIQRVFRGSQCRKTYSFVQKRVTKTVVYLQYLWRKKLHGRRVRRAMGYWTNRVLMKMFLLWKQDHMELKLEREREKAAVFAAKAMNFWGEKTLGRVFGSWKQYVKKKLVKAKKAIGFWKCQSLPRVLDAWRVYKNNEQYRRLRLTHVFLNAIELETHNSSTQLEKSKRANAVAKRLIWRLWKEFVVDQKRFLLKATLSIVCGSLSAWAFRQWYQNAARSKQSRDKTRKLLLKIIHREKTSVWSSWMEFVHGQKSKKRALLRFSNSIQVKCWLRWKQHHGHIQRLRNVSGRVAARFKMLNAGKAVATWYEFAQEQIEAKQRMRRALAYFTNASLVRTFSSWANHAAYMKAFRFRAKARMENANLAYALTSWITFTRLRNELHATATKIQAYWRGTSARRMVEDDYLYRIWAAMLIQTAWRGRLGRIIMRAANRKARLREYLRAERECDAIDAEEANMRKFNYEVDMIVLLQRQWRGVAARNLFIEVRRARFILKKQHETEMQEIVRAEARKHQLERIQHEKNRHLAAVEIQRHIRGYLGRKWYRSQQDFLHQQRGALRVQAVYRGRMSRRKTSALRRSYITRMEILARRAVEGTILRTLGAKTRPTQRGLRSFLEFFGLDPATFLTDIRAVMKEVKEDFQTMKKFFDVIKTKVNANAAKAALTASASPPFPTGKDIAGKAANLLKKTDAAKKFLSDFEQIMDATAAEREKHDQTILPGMAVRVVLRGHQRCGETAFVLGVKEEIAQLKMDVDGALEFFPLMIPETKVEPAKSVLYKIPELAFTAAYSNTVNGKISNRWRYQLEAYAETISEESKRFCAARVIQCAARVYLSRMKYQQELEAQGVNAARRQQALLRMLKTFGCANTRIANMLLQLRFVRALNLPPNLPDEPIKIQVVLDRFQRWLGRRSEIRHAYLRLVPEEFKGNGLFQGHMMPVPYTRVVDLLLHYPIQWLKRSTCVPIAQRLEKQGMADLAIFIGGSEFVKTFEELHTDAKEHFFPQLQNCSFCTSEGWSLVHGVFQKRKVPVEFPSLNNSSKKKKFATKVVPHGWGVAHFLTGHVGKKRNWLARNSTEAQFKSLQVVKAMKQKEREERLESQILARQGTLNTLRSAEGARGYAKRHAELSLLEEKTKVFFKRYIEEISLRDKEESKIFQEELRMNEVVAKEKAELEAQGQDLNELQQQVPEVVVEIEIIKSSKTALEFLTEGCFIDVEYDDEVWYQCQVIKIDAYETFTAEIFYVEDQRNEKIKLIESSMLDEKQFQKVAPPQPKTVAEITAAAAAKAEALEIPFRKWRAGNAVDIAWEPPLDNGAVITQFIIEWKDEGDETVTGKKEIAGAPQESVDSGGLPSATIVPSKTTLWPIPPGYAQTLRIRIAAENKKGVGLASVYTALPEEMITDVSYLTAVPLDRPPEDTTMIEKREKREMEMADLASLEYRRRLTCTICHENQPSEVEVHEHVAQEHAIPLICPFRSCRQVCASERALRYHIWRCSIPKPSPEELQSEIFMEIFNISRQYCFRKPRRHLLPGQSSLHEDGSSGEEVYLETKYQEARATWFEKAKELHEKYLIRDATARRREKESRYIPPRELFGLDFASPELNVARRNAVLSTIQELQADLEAYILETNTLMDQLKHEERELLDYIALKVKRMKTSEEEWQKQSLKREKKKAMKSLDQVQEKIATLMTTSTQRIHDMTTEISRLTTIEKAFVPFTHQVIKAMRLGTLVKETHAKSNEILRTHRVILDHFQEDLRKLMARAHHEVECLEAWDAMIEARRKQLQTLKDELRRLQLMHLAEIQSYKQKRDEGDETFELKKLREQQVRIITRQERAAQELLDSTNQTRGQAAAKVMAAKSGNGNADANDGISFELITTVKSLGIVNHDLVLHEKFIKGKSEDAEYLRDENVKQPGSSPPGNPMDAKFVNALKEETVAGQATGEPSSEAKVLIPVSADGNDHDGTEAAVDSINSGAAMRKSKKVAKRKKLHELPHTYVRLECNFRDGFIRDHVRIEYNDGSTYEGPWVEDMSYSKPVDMEPTKTKSVTLHWGKFTYFRDGTVWEGDDVDNFFSPFTATGESFYVTNKIQNTKYVGAVRMGKYHGFGTLHMDFVFSRGEYTGEWCEGKRHGYGIERFDVGEIYEGYWELDVYHGEGEIVYDDASRYAGIFRFGKWHGEGVRTLESGDRILGCFNEGLLNGVGVMEFADKRHYSGEFKNTRRHGLGMLTFPNGDRYEGPFEDDLPHGEGKFITKATPTGDNGDGPRSTGEPLVRIGKWVRGERTAWLSRPSSQVATSTFIAYFAVLQNLTGELEMDLLLPKFKTPFAVMVARMLPTLPEGVDGEDVFVRTIVKMLAKTQNIMVGADILDKTVAEHAVVAKQLDQESVAFEAFRNQVDEVEREFRFQIKNVNERQDEVDAMTTRELEMQVKLELFWKKSDAHALEANYKRAVEMLHDIDVMDWYKLRTAKLDVVYLSLLEAFATLLNFTTNFYLDEKQLPRPTREELMQLLSSSQENVFLGDREGLIHQYAVKALYVLPLFDVYSFGEGARNAMLHSLTHVIHHPRLRPNNFRLSQISPAATAVCVWVRAAFFYAKKATEIFPVVKRVLAQLVVLERLRDALEQEKTVLADQQLKVDNIRQQLNEKLGHIQELRTHANELQAVITGIAELDRDENVPIEKQHVKRPQTFRPPSAGVSGTSRDGGLLAGGDDAEDNDKVQANNASNKQKQEEYQRAQINHRQVFEETHDENAAAKQSLRLKKEQVLESILTNAQLAQEFGILKKEIRKVIDRNDGKVPLDEFPQAFLQVMLKSLDPTVFGVKKLRTLLALMDDTCVIVDPEREGDVESVQLPVEPDDVPMLPRLACLCRFCPGISYATRGELLIHEKTKWHFWNVDAKRQGENPMKWTLASTFWSEAYDSVDGAICYFNRMTGEVVKGDEAPPEMQASDVLLELLEDAPLQEAAASETSSEAIGSAQVDMNDELQLWTSPVSEDPRMHETADKHRVDHNSEERESQSQIQILEDGEQDLWEEVADVEGNVYFYNRITGEASWTHPQDRDTAASGENE